MSAGNRWLLPDGRQAIELERQGGMLRVAPIVPNWTFPAPPEIVRAKLCQLMPSRYLRGQVPAEWEEAPF